MAWNNGGSGGVFGPGTAAEAAVSTVWTSGGNGNSPWGSPPGPSEPPSRKPPPRGNGPWGGGGRGPGNTPPDLDELIAKVQAYLRGLLPRGFGGGGPRGRSGFSGGRGLALIAVIGVAVWLASGFYRVQPDEQGVVLRFGAYDRTTLPGLNYHIPWPVEAVELPAVTRINRIEVGYRSQGPDVRVQSGRDLPVRDVAEESLMLTGDENIIDIDCAVFWRIRDASAFLFNTRNPGYTVKSAAESVLREVIGSTPIQPALTDARARIEASVLKGVQAIVDQYGSGVEITQVQLQKVDPPDSVIESFRDVQRANTDADRIRNQAESYHNDIVPRARGDAARLVAEADADRQASAAGASGQAQRFLSVLQAYNAARDVTLTRLYIETMQDILTHTPSVIVDDKLQGVVPYLPLNDFGRPRPPAAPATGAPAPPAPSSPGEPQANVLGSSLRITP
jgi:membrane protease subunit HflK